MTTFGALFVPSHARMFVAVARVTLSIPDAGSLKSKRHVVHKVLDKVRARFNVSAAEVADLDLWQRATLGLAAVANEHAFAQESISKVVKFIEEQYVAPMVSWTSEVIPLGGDLFGEDHLGIGGTLRTLADAEREAAGRAGETPGDPLPAPRQRGGRSRAGKRAMTEQERVRALDDLRRRLRDARRGAPADGDDDEG